MYVCHPRNNWSQSVIQTLVEKLAANDAVLSKSQIDQLFSKSVENFLSFSQSILFEFLRVQESADWEALGQAMAKQALQQKLFLVITFFLG